MATHDYKITIKANDRQPVSGPVNFIRLHASTGNLKIDIEGKVTELAVGQAIVLDELVDLFHVVNESGSDINATFKLGAGARVTDNNLSGTVALNKATGAMDTADQSIANGATVTITPSATARALIIYFHPNNTGNLRTGPAAAAARGRIGQPGIEHVWNTTNAIKVHNDSGAAQTFGYAEETD